MVGRTICVLQSDVADCGAAALASVARHHGIRIGLEQARTLAGTDRIGTNLLGLLRAAEQLGFRAKAFRGSLDALRGAPLPAIGHLSTDEGGWHFVVIYRMRRGVVTIADPAAGIRKLDEAEFERRWSGHVVLLVPRPANGSTGGAAHQTSPGRRLLSLLRPNSLVLAEAFACAVLFTALGLSTAFFVQHLVDSILVQGELQLLSALAVAMLMIAVIRLLFDVIRRYLLVHMSRRFDLALVSEYTSHVMRLPMGFFQSRRVGEVISRVNDAVKVRQLVSGTALATLVDGTLVVIAVAAMLLYDATLTAVACAFIVPMLLAVAAHHRGLRRLSHTAMEKSALLQAHLVEDVSAAEAIKTLRMERGRAEQGRQRILESVEAGVSLQYVGLSMGACALLFSSTAGIAILWAGGHRVVEGAITIGQLMFFFTLLGHMLGPLERLARVNVDVQDALVALDRLAQILDLEREGSRAPGAARLERLTDAIELRGVSFEYGSRAKVLDGIDLRIRAGSTVAIVGASGSGKTTLLKLLARLHDPTEGRILIDGLDAREYDLDSLRSRIGWVSQDPFIFSGTIRDNIAAGRPGASIEQVVTAARIARLDEFIECLPERYDTQIGERGANLSGGQRQRLAIARAILTDPEILVFDEATSHLDPETERAVQEGLAGIFGEKTVLLVAHRLSTILAADEVFVLENGRVVEAGVHAELLARGGRYAHLWVPKPGRLPARTSQDAGARATTTSRQAVAAPGGRPPRPRAAGDGAGAGGAPRLPPQRAVSAPEDGS